MQSACEKGDVGKVQQLLKYRRSLLNESLNKVCVSFVIFYCFYLFVFLFVIISLLSFEWFYVFVWGSSEKGHKEIVGASSLLYWGR